MEQIYIISNANITQARGRRGRNRMLFGFTTTCACAISAYHPLTCEFESRSLRGAFDSTVCDKVSQ